MNFLRRTGLTATLVIFATLSMSFGPTCGQEFPSRPVRLVVPLSPGGVTDVMARAIAVEMGKHLGQSVIVENRTGANGAIAGDFVARAAPDGYTVGFFPNSLTVVLPLLGKLTNVTTDLKPVSKLYDLDLFVVARNDYPATTLAQLIALAKTQPGKSSYGTTGIGSTLHLGMELLKRQANFDMTHIPYRGGADQLNALLGGNLDVAIIGTYDAGVWLKQGKIKILASLGPKRNNVFPDVPTISESGFPTVIASSWAALFVPTSTPPAIAERLAQVAASALRDPAVRERLVSNGLAPVGDERPQETSNAMKVESEKWTKVIQQLGAANLQ